MNLSTFYNTYYVQYCTINEQNIRQEDLYITISNNVIMKSNNIDSDIVILKFLLNNKEKKFTIREISKQTSINYRITYEQIEKLSKEKLILVKKIGSSNITELTYNFNNKIYEAEFLRRESLFKNKEFKVIKNRLSELDFMFVALLFGSYARGTAKEGSDMDILIIGGDEDKINSALNLWQEKIHLTFVSSESFIRMAKSREFNVVNETIKNNVILVGIEEYYKLLNNARQNENK